MEATIVRPLAGVRVLDLSKVIAGPLCTQALADLGAAVIKVEAPAGGDETRAWPPLRDGTGAAFTSLNRGKRSLALDLKAGAAGAIVRRLAARADVVIESFAPAVKARLGVDEAGLRRERADLVYCSISGYGQTGPKRDDLGYDNVLQAFTGMMAMNGEPDRAPVRLPVSAIDQTTGLNAALGILAALMERASTGRGASLEVSLFDTAVAMLGFTIQGYWETGRVPERLGSAHASICPYQVFETTDRPVLLGIANDRIWARFARAIGRPELADDPRYRTNQDRVHHRAETVGLVQGIVRGRSCDHWVSTLSALDVPCAPVNDLKDLLESEHLAARGLVRDFADAPGLRAVAMPIVFDGGPRPFGPRPPRLGEHGAEILSELGYAPGEIDALVASRAVGDGWSASARSER